MGARAWTWTSKSQIPVPDALHTPSIYGRLRKLQGAHAKLTLKGRGTIQTMPKMALIILYYTILYYTILYYTILYYTILYYTILYYTILYCTIFYYTMNSDFFQVLKFAQAQLRLWSSTEPNTKIPCFGCILWKVSNSCSTVSSKPAGELETLLASLFGPYQKSWNWLFLGGGRTELSAGGASSSRLCVRRWPPRIMRLVVDVFLSRGAHDNNLGCWTMRVCDFMVAARLLSALQERQALLVGPFKRDHRALKLEL